MADPFTISMALSAGSAAIGAAGGLMKGAAESNMYNYQSGMALLNKKINLQNADYERKIGEVEAQQSGLKTRAEMGQTKAIQGASNLDVNTGSASLVRDSEHAIGVENQDIIRANAAHRAYGYEVKAAGDEAQSNIYQMSAKTSKTSGYLNAISSILGGASSVSSKWLQAGQVGLGGGGGSGLYSDPNSR